MIRGWLFICVALSAVVLWGVGCDPADEDDGVYTIDSDSDYVEAHIAVHELFRIRLSSNPSTGYLWELVSGIGQLEHIKTEYKQSPSCGRNMVGCGGDDLYTFRAVKAGETELLFVSQRPGNEDPNDARHHTVRVVAE